MRSTGLMLSELLWINRHPADTNKNCFFFYVNKAEITIASLGISAGIRCYLKNELTVFINQFLVYYCVGYKLLKLYLEYRGMCL